jgi:plastocyanin
MEKEIGPIRRRLLLAGVGLVGAAIGTAVWRRSIAPAQSAAVSEVAVMIQGFAFTPATLTVKAGTTVVWTNRDDEPHTVTEAEKRFKSPALDTDDSFRHRFDRAGTFAYVCSLHPHMAGRVTVEE